jgi:hypothetical protein
MNAPLTTPLDVKVVVEYRRDVPERYDLLISPVASGDVCVRLRSPVVGETICRLHRWPDDGSDGLAIRAVRSVVGCFFGGIHAAPRIVGAPDWTNVTLEVSVAGERRRRLLLAELCADTATHGIFTRHTGGRVLRDESVRLCPEDADAVYAVTRLVLSTARLAPVPSERVAEAAAVRATTAPPGGPTLTAAAA